MGVISLSRHDVKNVATLEDLLLVGPAFFILRSALFVEEKRKCHLNHGSIALCIVLNAIQR